MEINAIMNAKNIPDGYGKTNTSISSLKEKDRKILFKLFVNCFDVNGNGKLEQDELKTFNLAIKKYNKDFELSSEEVRALDAEYRKMMDLIVELGGKNDKKAAEKLKKIGAPVIPTLKITLNSIVNVIARFKGKLEILCFLKEKTSTDESLNDEQKKREIAEIDKLITDVKTWIKSLEKQKINMQKLLKEIKSSSF